MFLETKNLSYQVNKRRFVKRSSIEILKSVSLQINRGQSMTIIGPNGAGKTTLLKSLLHLLPDKDTFGEVLINGEPISNISKRELGKLISYVPQRPVLPSRMLLADYVLLGRMAHIPPFLNETKQDLDIVYDALEKTSMVWAKERMLGSLSGGELQLAAIARSLATRAPLLLLDEPTASLDLRHCYELCDLIYSLPKEGIAVIATMHDLALAARFGDELLLMSQGEVCKRGTASQVLTAENIQSYYKISVRTEVSSKGITILPN